MDVLAACHARAQLAAGVLLPALQQLQSRLRAVRTQAQGEPVGALHRVAQRARDGGRARALQPGSRSAAPQVIYPHDASFKDKTNDI
ncbi:hypothetical protein [Xanthomonas arboricola]|uniref:hypothetical protein n=1 Tax=Xanthomonas arboricola TaxID=56448 RepID=UPI0015E493F2